MLALLAPLLRLLDLLGRQEIRDLQVLLASRMAQKAKSLSAMARLFGRLTPTLSLAAR